MHEHLTVYLPSNCCVNMYVWLERYYVVIHLNSEHVLVKAPHGHHSAILIGHGLLSPKLDGAH